jgi:hypothetical protein
MSMSLCQGRNEELAVLREPCADEPRVSNHCCPAHVGCVLASRELRFVLGEELGVRRVSTG